MSKRHKRFSFVSNFDKVVRTRLEGASAWSKAAMRAKIRCVLCRPQGFRFYKAVGDYCGVNAHSLEEFANVLFHFERGDFQNWTREIIGNAELAQSP
jgi:hypothetical protein